jgi:predicted TIM-barrel fold metal-dependent hydrolase
MENAMIIIDAHCFVGNGRYKKQTAAQLLAAMENTGVEKAAICPVEEYSTVDNEEGNRQIAGLCRQYPDRFYGFAAANPWYGPKAEETLIRALDDGLNGVFFDSSLQGFSINDEISDPLMELCREYKAPAYFHTGTPAFALPLQLRYLALRHPKVNFIMGHMGANDFVSDIVPAMYQIENLYLETSMNLTCTLQDVLKNYPDRMIFGSASPRSHLDYELFKLRQACTDDTILEKVCGTNFQRIVGGRK